MQKQLNVKVCGSESAKRDLTEFRLTWLQLSHSLRLPVEGGSH